jgi:Fe-coproporphyrin III synthase
MTGCSTDSDGFSPPGTGTGKQGIPPPAWNLTSRDNSLHFHAAVLRGPVEWTWDVTNKCTGECQHCYNSSGVLERDELSDDEMQSVARQVAETNPLGICLCGGEPLLRLDAIAAIAPVLTDSGAEISLVTNGWLVSEEVAARLGSLELSLVQVSLDGARAETHDRLRRMPGAFERAVDAVRRLVARGLQVSVSFVPTRFNIEEWADLRTLCESLGVTELRFQPLMPLGQAALQYEELTPTPEQYRTLIDEYRRITCKPYSGMKVQWGDPVDHLIRFGQFYAMPPYTMHISSDGYLVPSVYLPVHLGNIRRHSLAEYWEAGLNKAWQLRLLRELAWRVRSNRDFGAIRPHPYLDAHIDLDLVDRSAQEIEALTDIALNFIEGVSPTASRPGGPWHWQPGSDRMRDFARTWFGEQPEPAAPGGSEEEQDESERTTEV